MLPTAWKNYQLGKFAFLDQKDTISERIIYEITPEKTETSVGFFITTQR